MSDLVPIHAMREDTKQALAQHLDDSAFEESFTQLKAEGYVVFESILSTRQIDAVRNALAPYFEKGRRGRNNFEGFATHREYGLMGKGAIFDELATHPMELAFAESIVGPSCLLSAFLAIQLYQGETV